MIAAQEHGKHLPHFASLTEAEHALFQRRDTLLKHLEEATPRSSSFHFDLSPESLKGLEKWYFALIEDSGFASLGMDRPTFETAIATYFGQVIVHNLAGYKWAVHEYAFEGGKYEIAVRRPLHVVCLTRPFDLSVEPNNKRRQSLWRRYRQHAG
jgi:hypothetical protein